MSRNTRLHFNAVDQDRQELPSTRLHQTPSDSTNLKTSVYFFFQTPSRGESATFPNLIPQFSSSPQLLANLTRSLKHKSKTARD